MRYLIYGDLQAGEGSEMCFNSPGIPLQRYRVKKFLQETLPNTYRTFDCDAIVDLGDTFDDRTAIPVPTLDVVVSGLKPFASSCEYNVKLIGNHDQFLRSTSIHSGTILEPIFSVVPMCKVAVYPDHVVAAVSFFDNEEEQASVVKKTLDLAKQSHKRILFFGHFCVSGCTNNGRTLDQGVNRGLLEQADAVFLGHIHARQSLTPKIHYVGSPFQQDFGEMTEKMVAVFDTETWSTSWVEVVDFPRYRRTSLSGWLALNRSLEDRVQVRLSSQADADKFFANPDSSRAIPLYEFSSGSHQPSTTSGNQDPVSVTSPDQIQAILGKYVEANPVLRDRVEDTELVQVGLDLVKGG